MSQYFRRFKANVETLEMIRGANVIAFKTIMGETWVQVLAKNADKQTQAVLKVKESFLVICLLMGANEQYFSGLKKAYMRVKTL